MMVRDIEFLNLTRALASFTTPVVVERRGGPDRRVGKDRRRARQSPVALQHGGEATSSSAGPRPTGTDLEYTTPWQLPPGDT